MDTKKFLLGTLAGGIVMYLTGYVIWDMAFAGFFAANIGSATGVARDAQLFWAVAVRRKTRHVWIALTVSMPARGRDVWASVASCLLAEHHGRQTHANFC